MDMAQHLNRITLKIFSVIALLLITLPAASKSSGYNPATFVPSGGSSIDIHPVPDATTTYTDNLASQGIMFQLDTNTLTITFDMNSVMAALPTLQQSGMISFIDDDSVRNSPYSVLINRVSFPITLNILQFLYSQHPDLDAIKIHTFIKPADGSSMQSCYYLDSTLAWIGDLNSEDTSAENLETAPGYLMDTWCADMINKGA